MPLETRQKHALAVGPCRTPVQRSARFCERVRRKLRPCIGARLAVDLRSPTHSLHEERQGRAHSQTFVFAGSHYYAPHDTIHCRVADCPVRGRVGFARSRRSGEVHTGKTMLIAQLGFCYGSLRTTPQLRDSICPHATSDCDAVPANTCDCTALCALTTSGSQNIILTPIIYSPAGQRWTWFGNMGDH